MTILQPIFSQENSQENIEFLSQDSFENLSDAYETAESNVMSLSFAKAYLFKAKQEKDSIQTADGHFKIAFILSKLLNKAQAKLHLDSVINITRENYTITYPAEAYILRANINGSQANFTGAIDDLTKATNYANNTNNENQKYQIKYFIALLKNNIGEYEEGLTLLTECLVYERTKFLKDEYDYKPYIKCLHAMGNQFNLLKLADSSLIYIKKAIDISLKTNTKYLYDRLILDAAVSYNLKKRYQQSLDNLLKYKEVIKTKESSIGSMIIANFYLGDAYYKLEKKEIALTYLRRVDSLAFAENYFFPGIESNYELLIDYHKNKDNIEQQLLYINKLLYTDSILDKDYAYLSKKLYLDYDTSNLIQEKQQIITKLEKEKNTRKLVLISLSILSIGLITLLLWNYKKQKRYKKRFQALLKNYEQDSTKSGSKSNAEVKTDLGISDDIVQDIVMKLDDFESKKEFLKMDLSVTQLAKQFKTNSKYFSKVINTYKNKSFTNYINDLRIHYIAEELKNNAKIRKYTVKAIANEIGFNTTEAFSKSFYKTTGIYPSYFIKQLEKNNKPL